MRLQGRVAIVTGGSQGIGAAIVESFVNEGATVAVVASTSKEKAQGVVDRLPPARGRAFAEVADVASADAVNALVERVIRQEKRIDILVNGAGVFYPTPAGETAVDELDRMIDINLKGTFLAISAVTPHMKAARAGRIINLSSVAGSMGIGRYAVYCATKAGVSMMTRALALELAPHGINVNAIAPGNTATPINEDIRTKPELASFLQQLRARTPSGRTYSTPQEMAAMAVFLASDDARSMHGSTVLMDEGFSAGI